MCLRKPVNVCCCSSEREVTHVYTYTHIYIYMYICMYVCFLAFMELSTLTTAHITCRDG